ncbi:hypothetical protein ACFUJ0_06235 [Streptomyces sp. NPDC057242]|uniref:hypothetical protein n=1 Tax=unclassified Streptomyces TaxID=2593676 RepID=UPI00363D863A
MPEATRRTDLTDLVSSRMRELDLSYRTLAGRTVDPDDPDGGPQWTRSTLENLVKGLRIKPPTPQKVAGLAAGLSLPVRLVQDAVRGQFFGVDSLRVGEESLDEDALIMLRHYETLSVEDRLKLRKIAEDWSRMTNPAGD